MTRTAILIPCLATGGTEVATLETARALIELGHTVHVLVYFDEVDQVMLETFEAAGITVDQLGLPRSPGFTVSLRLAGRLQQALRRGRFGLVWVQYMTPTLVPLVVARPFTRRLIAAVHVAGGHYGPLALRRLRWLARWWCDRFVCVSQTSARGIFGDALQDAAFRSRVLVLPNAVDLTAVEAAVTRDWRRELQLPDDSKIIGYVGRLAHNKGVDILLRATAQLSVAHPRLRWVIVGDGAERHDLERLTAELGLSDVVYFIGNLAREAVFGAFKGFDIAVVPSREEGFGLSAVEAMACGVPLVASAVDALTEVVSDKEAGLLFAPEDPVDLASKIQWILRDELTGKRLGQAGAAHVRERFGQETYRAKIVRLVGSREEGSDLSL